MAIKHVLKYDAAANPGLRIPSGGNLSSYIGIGNYIIGLLIVPALDSSTELRFLGAESPTDTFRDIYDEAGTIVKITASAGNRVVRLHTAVMANKFIKIHSVDTAGADKNQTANRDFVLILVDPGV